MVVGDKKKYLTVLLSLKVGDELQHQSGGRADGRRRRRRMCMQ